MAALLRQTVSEPQKPFWYNVIYILGLVIVINILVELTNFLPPGLSSIASILVLIIAGVFIFYFVNRRLAQYTYILIEDELIFHKKIGSKENKMLNVKIYDIDWIKPLNEITDKGVAQKVYCLSCKIKGKGIYVGQFKKDNKTYRFIFQPNEALYSAITKQMNVKNQ